jgi:hypothetical protein
VHIVSNLAIAASVFGAAGAGGGSDVRTFTTITAGQTTTLVPNQDADLDTSGGSVAAAKLEVAPTAGSAHSFKWIAGAILPVINGNGANVEQFASLGTYAATTTINQLNQGGTLEFTGVRWEWR